MEDKDENVVEETTKETVDTVETNKKNINEDGDYVVDKNNPPKKKKMPLESKAQMRYLFATNPKLAKRYVKKTSKQKMKNLPEKKAPTRFKMKNPLLKK